jgi:DNA-binding response OmpR family regulator
MNTEHVQRQPRRVLIIHSEAPLVEFLKLGLRYEGFHVEAVAEGATGLAAASREPPELVLLGHTLADMDGLEVCRSLRSRLPTRTLPILLLAPQGEIRDRVIGLEAGADDYLTIPFRFDELLARAHVLLRRSHP